MDYSDKSVAKKVTISLTIIMVIILSIYFLGTVIKDAQHVMAKHILNESASYSIRELTSLANADLSNEEVKQMFYEWQTDNYSETYIVNSNMKDVFDPKNEIPVELFNAISETDQNIISDIMNNWQSNDSEIMVATKGGFALLKSINYDNLYTISVLGENELLKNNKYIQNIVTTTLLICFSAFAIVLIYLMLRFKRSKQKLYQADVEHKTIISNIPGGVIRFELDGIFPIQFINDGLIEFCGFTRKELSKVLGNSFLNLIHAEDRKLFSIDILSQIAQNKSFCIECRILKKGGESSWFLVKGKLLEASEQFMSCACVLTDISTRKTFQKELDKTNERYKIVIEQSDSIIFEYNFDDETIYLSNKWKEKFNYPNSANVKEFFTNAVESDFIYSEDSKKIVKIFRDIKKEVLYKTATIRLRDINGSFIWCSMKVSSIADEYSRITKAIGKISDVNNHYNELQILKEKATIDKLSGVYNKATAENLIDEWLKKEGVASAYALLILDIDNFKKINDSMGHLIGDSVISQLCPKIKSVLRRDDIFGRIGGDEFVILLKGTNNIQIIKDKSTEIGKAFNQTLTNEERVIEVSGSIGIILSDNQPFSYKQLVEKADLALYESKKNGKNQYTIYRPMKKEGVDYATNI